MKDPKDPGEILGESRKYSRRLWEGFRTNPGNSNGSDYFQFGFITFWKGRPQNASSDSVLQGRRKLSILKIRSSSTRLWNLESIEWVIFEVAVCHGICRFWTKTREFWAKSGFFRLEFQNWHKYGFFRLFHPAFRLSSRKKPEAGKSRNSGFFRLVFSKSQARF